ncbi:PAQR family membrane homeostasis protein TrhA [Companilactobacillus sp.]|uniref:PAQR family membrane homeostasis protein TrhA n=1 Tax=Companilactobacillus sp. TaxID=2767905 RepID=UPI0025C44C11|nr:hemolysin III family protein [Companilactobacillus sp.]MCH4008303.1 hemolysin III family protein [Companilactobacillus sp.]MCH4051518.1 hemolysin III family protein [Companilactobacillus sp.]MCH4076246.1 hemolysin III family protein [Companilactobacillus sp.]MCH4124821.1 hemolysin III family protein [Companilactobacillus sp.]MCH4131363.1 hemolysin III family protein [Companilactobacillus sp.]
MNNKSVQKNNPSKKFTKKYRILNEIFSAVTHGIGIVLAIIAAVFLLIKGFKTGNPLTITAFFIYAFTLFFLYLSSTLFHSLYFTKAKGVFQIFDHSSIFLMIAGTYTPYCLVALKSSAFAITLLSIIWALAIGGILYKIFNVGRFKYFETLLYVLMGWAIVIAMKPLYSAIGATGTWLLIFGGIAFTLGAGVYLIKNLKFVHVIWHVFVMIGTALMYFSVYFYVG